MKGQADVYVGDQLHVFARPTLEGGQLTFLCSNCGRCHFHGGEEGHRVAHCPDHTAEGYHLHDMSLTTELVLGQFTEGDGLRAINMIETAREHLSSVWEYTETAVGRGENPHTLKLLRELKKACKILDGLTYSKPRETCLVEKASGFELTKEAA